MITSRRLSASQVALLAHGYGAVMGIVAMIPGLNWLYSGHGGAAWLLLSLAFPLAILAYAITYLGAAAEQRGHAVRCIGIAFGGYVCFSLIAAWIGAASIRRTLGLQMEPLALWGRFFFPVDLFF